MTGTAAPSFRTKRNCAHGVWIRQPQFYSESLSSPEEQLDQMPLRPRISATRPYFGTPDRSCSGESVRCAGERVVLPARLQEHRLSPLGCAWRRKHSTKTVARSHRKYSFLLVAAARITSAGDMTLL